jgi:hypothetical protein
VTCPFAHDDGAYVLGALSPVERLEFERHRASCEECTRSVGELAGLPGLLGRVDPRVLDELSHEEEVPPTLLPALSREVTRVRRRRVIAAGVLAAAAVVTPVAVGQLGDDGATVPAPSASPSAATPMEMQPVGEVPVRATVALEQVTWGTRLVLSCTYDTESVEYDLPPAVDYTLFIRTRDGAAEQVGSWRSVDGKSMQLAAATAASREEIASVEVRTLDGRVVLKLAA